MPNTVPAAGIGSPSLQNEYDCGLCAADQAAHRIAHAAAINRILIALAATLEEAAHG